MKTVFVIAILALYVATTTAQRLPPLEQTTIELEPFSTIHDCLPFNLKVEPVDTADYQLSIEAEAPLLESVSHSIEDGVLYLGISEGFNTSRVIKVVVYLPSDALETVMSASTSHLVVSAGFSVPSLTVSTSGLASIRVFDIEVEDLVMEGADSSTIFVQGEVSSARVDVSGTSRAYLYGVEESIEVHADGIGRVFVDAANNEVEITGRLSALGRVYSTGGQCSVRGSFHRDGCAQINPTTLPEFGAEHSCGLIVDGSINCNSGRRGAASYTSTTVDGVTASTFTSGTGSATATAIGSAAASSSSQMTGTGGTTSTFSSSSFSGLDGGRFESIVSTQGGDEDDVVAVAATRCFDEELGMFDL